MIFKISTQIIYPWKNQFYLKFYGLIRVENISFFKYSNKPNRQLRLVTPLFLTATIT
jgi:hypothetical protein